MVTEDYVSFETAKLMHDKGFNLAEFHGRWAIDYDNVPITDEEDPDGKIIVAEWQYPLITLQMAMKWLREEKGIAVIPVPSSVLDNERFLWDVKVVVAKTNDTYSQGWVYEKQEAACERAVKYCLENLIQP